MTGGADARQARCGDVQGSDRALQALNRTAAGVDTDRMDRETSPAAMARISGILFVGGAALTAVGIALPHSPQADVTGFWAIAGVTLLVGCILLGSSERLPLGGLQLAMFLASGLVGLSLLFNGERHGGPSAGNEVLFLWVALYCGYYFPKKILIAELVALAVVDAAALIAVDPGNVGYTRWSITVGAAALAGIIVSRLRQRNDELVAQLVQAGRIDQLTGALNRRGFQERLDQELASSDRSGLPAALVLADLDHFKSLNDTHGHPVGDSALAAVGEAARLLVRRSDAFARLGGDEFAAILPGTDADGALLFAERMRERVAELQISEGVALRMSLGIALYPSQCDSEIHLIEAADAALYAAKRQGGNQTLVFRPPPDATRYPSVAAHSRHSAAARGPEPRSQAASQ
jgi:diguanylate cyclase (GGDEF)-like protein